MADEKPTQLDPEWDVYGMQPWIVYLSDATVPMLNAISQKMAPSNGCARMMHCEVIQFAVLSLYGQVFGITGDDGFNDAPTVEEVTDGEPPITLDYGQANVPDLAGAAIGPIFDACWDRLAAHGRCDSKGGAEHTRIKALFFPNGLMRVVLDYITEHANKPAPATPENPSSPDGTDPDDNIRITRHPKERGS